VPRWSMSTTLKLFTADLSQPEASLGRGDSKPGPPGGMGRFDAENKGGFAGS
jgi:hypothetical protein